MKAMFEATDFQSDQSGGEAFTTGPDLPSPSTTTKGSGRLGRFELETCFEWDTTRICTRAYIVFNIHQ